MSDCSDWDDPLLDDESLPALRRKARKAWRIIRTKIHEVAEDNRARKNIGFNWTLLTQHIAYMTDQEKARQELYDKYLNHPNQWAEGLVNYPAHLFTASRQRAVKYKLRTIAPGLAHTSSQKKT